MPVRKKPNSEPKASLKLSTTERRLILETLSYVDGEYVEAIRATPSDQPVRLTLTEWEGLSGCVAAETTRIGNKALGRRLDRLLARIDGVLERGNAPTHLRVYQEEEEPVPQDGVALASYAAMMLGMADQMCEMRRQEPSAVRSARNVTLSLGKTERLALAKASVNDEIKSLLTQSDEQVVQVSINDLASMLFALSEEMANEETCRKLQGTAIAVVHCLTDAVQRTIRPQGPLPPAKKRWTRKSSDPEVK